VLGDTAEAEAPARAWPIPARYAPERLTDRRVLYVGDSAGVVDPMTGEGIAQALDTGILAARAVARGGGSADVEARYRAWVRRDLGRDLRFAAFLQPLLGSELGARAAIRGGGLSDWVRRNFVRWMFEDYPRALILTPHRWRRGMFHRRGAYRHA
jgi:flavin-dependent dehydrogenase